MNVADYEIYDLKDEQNQFIYALDLLESLNLIVNKHNLKEKRKDLKSFYNWLENKEHYNMNHPLESVVESFLRR